MVGITGRAGTSAPVKKAVAACEALGHPKQLQLFNALLHTQSIRVPVPVVVVFVGGGKRRRNALEKDVLDKQVGRSLVAPKRYRKHLKRLNQAGLITTEKSNARPQRRGEWHYRCSVDTALLDLLRSILLP